MKFSDAIKSACGLRYMFDTLELQSGFSRRILLESHMMTSPEEITDAYAKLRIFIGFTAGGLSLRRLKDVLARLKDIRGTIDRLAGGDILDDVALFEIKELCLLSGEAAVLLKDVGAYAGGFPSLTEALDILDPDKDRLPVFHIYGSYSERLRRLRAQYGANGRDDGPVKAILEEEQNVRRSLSERLRPYAPGLMTALTMMAETDILQAKAAQANGEGLAIPAISRNGKTVYSGVFHPWVRSILGNGGGSFQPVDISFGGAPVVIVGANMGGKTVVLKMIALCQLLFQFGFGVPASSAGIDIKEGISLYIGEEESPEKGLSAFGTEIGRIGEIISSARKGANNLALIDEPARTTNPMEGTALVGALLSVMDGKPGDMLVTTHYSITKGPGKRLRVRGFRDGVMDYSLEAAEGGTVPCEAINIAQRLGADPEWLGIAREYLLKGDGSVE